MAPELFTDSDLRAINRVRTILAKAADKSRHATWEHRDTPVGQADAADYGALWALCDVAGDSLFTVLNWTNAHNIQPIPGDVLHNRQGS
jgi:hypothetical protein